MMWSSPVSQSPVSPEEATSGQSYKDSLFGGGNSCGLKGLTSETDTWLRSRSSGDENCSV